MTLKFPRLALADGTADKVLRDLGINKLPIDPVAVAASKDITVEAAPGTMTGFSGMLAQWDTSFGILYATHIESEGFRRFSIAHELGHYFMPEHMEQVLANGPHQSRAGFGSRDPYEQEADFFAAALLMPTRLLRPVMNRSGDGMAAVQATATTCVTSLTASAVRYAQVGRNAVAVVLSTEGVIDFCMFSEAMKEAKVRWLKPGTPVPGGTVTEEFGRDKANIAQGRSASGEIGLGDWFESPKSHKVSEEVVGLGSYGKALTIVRSARLTDQAEGLDDDEDDDEAVEERWAIKFHK
jgi:Zn-dependent peptidase ImmA (M78 family)